jgi:hypothetical protein
MEVCKRRNSANCKWTRLDTLVHSNSRIFKTLCIQRNTVPCHPIICDSCRMVWHVLNEMWPGQQNAGRFDKCILNNLPTDLSDFNIFGPEFDSWIRPIILTDAAFHNLSSVMLAPNLKQKYRLPPCTSFPGHQRPALIRSYVTYTMRNG